MYCSENCCNSDWISAHKEECNKTLTPPLPFRPFKVEEFTGPSAPGSGIYSIISITIRLIARIGLDNIRQIVLQNKPMPSLLGDPRTKGFQDGKFEAASLEALLSLEDNFEKLTSTETNLACNVSLTFSCGTF
jgi:hypothetical protein